MTCQLTSDIHPLFLRGGQLLRLPLNFGHRTEHWRTRQQVRSLAVIQSDLTAFLPFQQDVVDLQIPESRLPERPQQQIVRLGAGLDLVVLHQVPHVEHVPHSSFLVGDGTAEEGVEGAVVNFKAAIAHFVRHHEGFQGFAVSAIGIDDGVVMGLVEFYALLQESFAQSLHLHEAALGVGRVGYGGQEAGVGGCSGHQATFLEVRVEPEALFHVALDGEGANEEVVHVEGGLIAVLLYEVENAKGRLEVQFPCNHDQ